MGSNRFTSLGFGGFALASALASALAAVACGFAGEGTLEGSTAATEPAPGPAAPGRASPPPSQEQPSAPDSGPGPSTPVTPCSEPTLSFDGVDDAVTVADDSELDLGNDFTVEAWIKPGARATTGEEMDVLSHHDPNASQGWALIVKAGRIEIVVWGNESFSSTAFSAGNSGPTYVTAGKWAHVAGTKEGDTLRVYYDGVLRDTQKLDFLFGRDTYSGALRMGRAANAAAQPFQGELDDVRLSHVARYTDATAATPKTLLPIDNDTVALWHFDEPSGATLVDAKGKHPGTMAPDSTAPTRVASTCIANR